jgi:hypothetical protein
LAHYSVLEFLFSDLLVGQLASFRLDKTESRSYVAGSCAQSLLRYPSPGWTRLGGDLRHSFDYYAIVAWENFIVPAALTDLKLRQLIATFLMSQSFDSLIEEKETMERMDCGTLHEVIQERIIQCIEHSDSVQTGWCNSRRPRLANHSGLLYPVVMQWTDVVRIMMPACDVDQLDNYYGTPLMAAARIGHLDFVEASIDGGARVDTQGGIYGTALQAAALGGHLKVVEFFRTHGASPNVAVGLLGCLIQAASIGGHLAVVNELLVWQPGIDINKRGGHHGTALQAAVRAGHLEVV